MPTNSQKQQKPDPVRSKSTTAHLHQHHVAPTTTSSSVTPITSPSKSSSTATKDPFTRYTSTAAYILLSLPMTFVLFYLLLAPTSTTSTSTSSSSHNPSSPFSFFNPFSAATQPCNQNHNLPQTLNISIHIPSIPFAPDPLPPPHHSSDSNTITPLVLNLTRSTPWKSIANISLQGETFEPEGLLRLGPDRFLLSSSEYTSSPNPNTTSHPSSGIAHLLLYTAAGTLIADASISSPNSTHHHNGGIDYDGTHIWGVLSPYFPSSSATIYRASPHSLFPSAVLSHSDHIGAIAVDPTSRSLTLLNWGSRLAATLPIPHHRSHCITPNKNNNNHPKPVRNPSHLVDYQDCKFLGPWETHTLMLCSGVAALGRSSHSHQEDHRPYTLGGIALVDAHTMEPVAEVPITLESEKGVRMTQNPMDVSAVDGKLRMYWVPDQHQSVLYIFEAQL